MATKVNLEVLQDGSPMSVEQLNAGDMFLSEDDQVYLVCDEDRVVSLTDGILLSSDISVIELLTSVEIVAKYR